MKQTRLSPRHWCTCCAAALLVAALLVPQAAFAGKKALVVGVNDYESWTDLKNAGNDARDVAAELKTLGFSVTSLQDPTNAELNQAMNTWADSLGKDDTGLFYFAGHGFQIRSEDARGAQELVGNYLVPRDMPDSSALHITKVGKHALSLEDARTRLRFSSPKALIFILDACRNNPWVADRAAKRSGLAPVAPAQGEFFVYATGEGRTSSDNPNGRNGLFTKMLLRELRKADKDVEDMLKRVGHAVAAASGNSQVPYRASSLSGEVWLGAAGAGAGVAVATATQPTSSGGSRGGGAAPTGEACPFPGILMGGDPDEPGAMACYYAVEGTPPGGFGKCDLKGGQIGYGWPDGADDTWECEPGFVRQDTSHGPFCSVALQPPSGAQESCGAEFASDGFIGFQWPAAANPTDVARAAAAAAACPAS
jgi:hypothetical protein